MLGGREPLVAVSEATNKDYPWVRRGAETSAGVVATIRRDTLI